MTIELSYNQIHSYHFDESCFFIKYFKNNEVSESRNLGMKQFRVEVETVPVDLDEEGRVHLLKQIKDVVDKFRE